MKEGKLVQTANVQEATRCIHELQLRPKLEMVGLGLIYGAPGLGKTTWAHRLAYSQGYIYIRLESTTTTKAFATCLFKALASRFGLGDLAAVGTSNGLFQRCLSILDNHPDAVIIIDEIDYGFKNPALLGALRDIVDESLAIVILVGMENAMERLLQINRYYFDRCSQFYQFTPSSLKDIAQICAAVLDIEVSGDLVTYIHRLSSGNLRQAVKVIVSLEELAKAQNLKALTLADLEGVRK